jgi:hypothetical protein
VTRIEGIVGWIVPDRFTQVALFLAITGGRVDLQCLGDAP